MKILWNEVCTKESALDVQWSWLWPWLRLRFLCLCFHDRSSGVLVLLLGNSLSW